MTQRRSLLGRLLTCLTIIAAVGHPAAAAPDDEQARFFEAKVRPVFVEHCVKCHGPQKQKGGLRIDSRAALLGGGDQGPAIVPGKPGESLLIQALSHQDELKMPPSKKIPKDQIAALTAWVASGAAWPGPAAPESTAPVKRGEYQISERDRAHWAFQPVKPSDPPAVRLRSWVANPVDAFILHKLEAKGLRPNPPATRRELIRRLYYDLTGLPPTPEEVEAFAADASANAYETLVDKLLASPRYGEKWGRHWLDLVRFAETNSYERDGPKPHAWRFRDYVIRSFNADKPYDRFVREQLAGDELPDRDADSLIATGYYRLGIWDDEPSDRLQARYDVLDDIVATTGQVFLGMTVDCARCHDHKIDPIPQKDYYRLLSFFQNLHDYHNAGPTDEIPLPGGSAGGPAFEHEHRTPAAGPAERTARPLALAVTEMGTNAPDTFVLVRGSPNVRGDKVEPGFLRVLGGADPVIPRPAPGARTCGRRTVLADWIASPDNPLTARVMVNRVWQHHFGRGIVRSTSNFGTQGDRPTHPELLDWLAGTFVREGWRLKPLHRLLVTSNAYQMSSRGNQAALAVDQTNDLFWRFDMRRLAAEEIRDSVLAVSGNLNLKMYGPGVYTAIPAEVMAGQSMPGSGWGHSPPEEQSRRSIYVHAKRSLLTPVLVSFDVAETDRSASQRFATTQPTQALALLNSEFARHQAALFAGRLRREAGDDVALRVRLGLQLAACRPPTDDEVRRGVKLIEDFRTKDGVGAEAAVNAFCLMVLNLNEFVYLD